MCVPIHQCLDAMPVHVSAHMCAHVCVYVCAHVCALVCSHVGACICAGVCVHDCAHFYIHVVILLAPSSVGIQQPYCIANQWTQRRAKLLHRCVGAPDLVPCRVCAPHILVSYVSVHVCVRACRRGSVEQYEAVQGSVEQRSVGVRPELTGLARPRQPSGMHARQHACIHARQLHAWQHSSTHTR